MFPYSGCPDFALPWRICARQSSATLVLRACMVSGQFSPVLCPRFGSGCSSPSLELALASAHLISHPRGQDCSLECSTRLEHPLHQSLASGPVLTAGTPPSSSPGLLTGPGQLRRPKPSGGHAYLGSGGFTAADEAAPAVVLLALMCARSQPSVPDPMVPIAGYRFGRAPLP